jgi:hypothetical protein
MVIMLVDERHRPYTYLLPYPMFPERVLAINLATGTFKQLADKPLEDTIPNIHDAVEAGPREFDWRSDTPATISWVEAADGGDPRKDVPATQSSCSMPRSMPLRASWRNFPSALAA